jgi:serine/threonine-protein kinase ULK/ATG1
MLYGECPYEEKTIAKLIQRIQSNDPVVFNMEVNRITEKTEILLQKMLRIDVEKRMTFAELFADDHVKRYYPSKEFDFSNVVKTPNELDTSMKPMRIKKDRAIKYLYHERNKLYFMYNVLGNVLELNCSNISALVAFFLMKFIRNTARYLKKNLLDQINPSAFLQLKKLIENWGALANTFEYKSFVNLVNKELEIIEKEYPAFVAEAERFKTFTIGSNDYNAIEVEKELEREELEVRIFAKYMIQYVEEIKRTYFFSPLDQKNDEENMKYLRHINEVLDVLLIDEFFENFLDIYVKYENQKYFEMIKRYAKDHLLNIVTNKIVFTKSKLGV